MISNFFKKAIFLGIVFTFVFSLGVESDCLDGDKDGHCVSVDCDDGDAQLFRLVDFYLDEDHDGYGSGDVLETRCWGEGGYFDYPLDERSFNNQDCDDLNGNVNPGKEEICGDGVDQNCDSVDLRCPSRKLNLFSF